MCKSCPECAAPLPPGGACRDYFHELLVLEGGFPGAAGSILHFYAVASYNLQHPEGSAYTPEALAGLRRNLADVLDGKLDLPSLRARTRRHADGPARVLRREGDPAPPLWPVGGWPMNVTHVLSATAESYPHLVSAWARSVRETLEAAER